MKLNNLGEHQNELIYDTTTVLISYSTPVAYIDHNTGIAYKTKQKWSVTTSKHINKWLNSYSAETVNLIEQSELDGLRDGGK